MYVIKASHFFSNESDLYFWLQIIFSGLFNCIQISPAHVCTHTHTHTQHTESTTLCQHKGSLTQFMLAKYMPDRQQTSLLKNLHVLLKPSAHWVKQIALKLQGTWESKWNSRVRKWKLAILVYRFLTFTFISFEVVVGVGDYTHHTYTHNLGICMLNLVCFF